MNASDGRSVRLSPSTKASSSVWTQVLVSGETELLHLRWGSLRAKPASAGYKNVGETHLCSSPSWRETPLNLQLVTHWSDSCPLVYTQSPPLKRTFTAFYDCAHTILHPLLQPRSLFSFPPSHTWGVAPSCLCSCCFSFHVPALSKPYLLFQAHLWLFFLSGAFPEQFHTLSSLQHWPSGLTCHPVIPSLGCTFKGASPKNLEVAVSSPSVGVECIKEWFTVWLKSLLLASVHF